MKRKQACVMSAFVIMSFQPMGRDCSVLLARAAGARGQEAPGPIGVWTDIAAVPVLSCTYTGCSEVAITPGAGRRGTSF